ncbi:NAD-dependent protein deacylase [Synergistales bacterium]|nr:NAD-dependent protein deacylase [Synergistales bacterium]
MKRLVVLTGAGISVESGFKTFRGSDGLWEEHRVEDVASIEGWERDPELVIDFYNMLRKKLKDAKPNEAHKILAELENSFEVYVITQNVDDLHERGGSTNIIHLHGELTKVRSVRNDYLIKDIGYGEISYGEKGEDGAQLRPHIVWFGEAVPMIETAARTVREADIFAVIGSSLVVYPAAGLVSYMRPGTPAFLIDPNEIDMRLPSNFTVIKDTAANGTRKMRDILAEKLGESVRI